MNCLIAAATVLEINPFLEELKAKNGMLFNHNIDVLITGIGLTAATYSIAKQIHIKRPDIVIQAGIAGCFDSSFSLGSVVTVKKETIADLGVIESGRLNTVFNMGFSKPNQFPYSNKWLINKNELLKKIKLKKVTAVSVNEITTNKKKINLYKEHFSPVVESMEGAALHYVCLMEQVPFLQLRSISNYAGERNKKRWNMKDSIKNLNTELLQMLAVL